MPSIAEKAIEEAFRALVIRITENSGNTLTDYQVKIVLNETNFTDWDKVLSDGSDIFFLDENGNPLYFWIEEFDKTAKKATIWVKVPSIPANGETTIYMCYGGMENPFSSYHDPENVFDFFDDFEGTELDTTKWNTHLYSGGSIVVSDGYVKLISAIIVSKTYQITDGIIETKGIMKRQEMSLFGRASVNSGDAFESCYGLHTGSFSDTSWNFVIVVDNTDKLVYDPTPTPTDTEVLLRFIMNGNELTGQRFNYNTGEQIGSTISTTHTKYSQGYIGLRVDGIGDREAWYDWIRVRKYVDPEPSISIVESKFLAKHRIDLY